MRQIRSAIEGQDGRGGGSGNRRPGHAHVAEAGNRQQDGRRSGNGRARRVDQRESSERQIAPEQSSDREGDGFDQPGKDGDPKEDRQLRLAVEGPEPWRDDEHRDRDQNRQQKDDRERRPDVLPDDFLALDQEVRGRELAQTEGDEHDPRADHGHADLRRGEQARDRGDDANFTARRRYCSLAAMARARRTTSFFPS